MDPDSDGHWSELRWRGSESPMQSNAHILCCIKVFSFEMFILKCHLLISLALSGTDLPKRDGHLNSR